MPVYIVGLKSGLQKRISRYTRDEQGLISNSRLYVHLSKDYKTEINGGKRHRKPLFSSVA